MVAEAVGIERESLVLAANPTGKAGRVELSSGDTPALCKDIGRPRFGGSDCVFGALHRLRAESSGQVNDRHPL